MNIVVLLRMVPDVVEELEIAPEGNALDDGLLRMILSESDDHALEQAILLKETYGGRVTALAPEAAEVDDALFAALARGADRAVKITDLEPKTTARGIARAFAEVIRESPELAGADLILTGVQAFDDLDGVIAPLLAWQLKLPHAGVVTRVTVAGRMATVVKEYAGGVRAELELPLPAVLGIQAAEKPPRYVPVAKVRAVMKAQRIETLPVPAAAACGLNLIQVIEMARHEPAGHAEMLEGSPEEVAETLCGILAERGVL